MVWTGKRTDTAADRRRQAEYASAEYRAMRRALRAEVDAGRASCWRCGRWIDPSLRDRLGRRLWHVGHDDVDRTLIRGAEHAACNLKKAASKGARVVNARRSGRTTGTTTLRL